MTTNHKGIRVVGSILLVSTGALISRYSPERNFILGPGFDSKEEIGYIRAEENQIYETCKENIYIINKTPNHIGTLTSKFEDSTITVKVTVDNETSNPFILIKSPDEQVLPICDPPRKDEGNNIEELSLGGSRERLIHSDEYVYELDAGSYQVWIGDAETSDKPIKYTIEITEDEDI